MEETAVLNRRSMKDRTGLIIWFGLVGLVALTSSPGAWGLVEGYEPTPTTYVLYTFYGCGLLFLGIITLILRAYRWLQYVVLAAAMLLNRSAVSGALPYWLGGSDFVMWVIPYLVISFTTTLGYWVAGNQLDPGHRFSRYRRWCYMAALVSAIGPVTSYFWLMKIPLNLMWLPQLVLFYSMYAVLMLPPWTWQVETTTQKYLTRSFPVVTGLPFLLLPFFEEPGYGLIGDTAQKLEMFGAGAHFLYVWVLALWLGISGQTARREAERQALLALKNEAEMQLALREAEQEYQRAHAVASESRKQLATLSHDLKQPLASLRVAVEGLEESTGGADSRALSRAVDYVEDLARAYGTTDAPGDLEDYAEDPEAVEAIHGELEAIDVDVLMDSLRQMFSEQARQQHIALTVPHSPLRVQVPPLDAMRVLSNLLANAIQHAQASTIRLAIEPQGDRVHVSVLDDGAGMDEATLLQMRTSGQKGLRSQGDGLGLAIVQDLCAARGWALDLRSQPGSGTHARIAFPACL